MDKAQELYNNSNASKQIKKEIHPLAMWSFGFAIAPLFLSFFWSIPILGLIIFLMPFISICLGSLSLFKIKGKFIGKGFAIGGIIISIIQLLILFFFVKFFQFIDF